MDYLGTTFDEQYLYFELICRDKVTIKEMLELKHYIGRVTSNQLVTEEFDGSRWIQLTLLFYTNYVTSASITPRVDKQQRHL